MKNKVLFFIFFLVFVLSNGFSQQASGNNQLLDEIRKIVSDELSRYHGEERSPQGSLVPLTWETVRLVSESNQKDEFKNLDYYLSADFTLSRSDRTIESSSRGLVINHGNTTVTTVVSRTTKGECIGYDDTRSNEESFIVKFQELEIQFRRNLQTGRFDAVPVGTDYVFYGPLPYLCIYLDQRGVVGSPVPQSIQPRIPASYSSRDQLPSHIMTNGILNRDVIVSYIFSKNPNPLMPREQIMVLVDEYINEAHREGVNHDIAIAQMCYATGFLSNRQLLSTYNYAGLNTSVGISVRHGNRHTILQEGVWAHIQHLKGYASWQRPRRDIVDRRYELLVRDGILGNVTTLEGLFSVWSPYNARNYGNEIRRILSELYQFPGRF